MNPTTLTRRAVQSAAAIGGVDATLRLKPVGSNTSFSGPGYDDTADAEPNDYVLRVYAEPIGPEELQTIDGLSEGEGAFRLSIAEGTTDQNDNVYGEAFPSPEKGRERLLADVNDTVEFPYGNRTYNGRVVGDEPRNVMGGWYSLHVATQTRSESA